jgi:hypothetical protein
MPIVKIVSGVKQRKVMAALNGKPLDADRYATVKRSCDNPLAGTGRNQRRLLHSITNDPILMLTPDKTLLDGIVTTRLRLLVDEWLSTGVDSTGAEVLEHRSLLSAPRATRTLRDYASTHRLRLLFFPKYPEFIIKFGDVDEDQPEDSLHIDHNDPIVRAWGEAAHLFAGLTMRDWGGRLCKCRYASCGRYFLHDKPRRAYRHGTFCCPAHRARASAMTLTASKRSQAKSSLIGWAASWLVKKGARTDWKDEDDLKSRLAAFLSKRVSESDLTNVPDDLKVNWVTRHCTEIEQRRVELSKIR